ncbi:hypothetical protein [Nocardia sp. SC052]|uniref:hypothetical protein n=1 Tax=Nocardia sichangensis TaxID=3385975 RepID=UPI00399FF79A
MPSSNANPSGESQDGFERQARELAELLKVTPPGDHPIVAEHLGNGVVLYIAGALSDIRQTVEIHHDMAPVAAHRVMEYTQQTADLTLKWLRTWAG